MTSKPISEEEFFANVLAPAHGMPVPPPSSEKNPTYNGSCHCGFDIITARDFHSLAQPEQQTKELTYNK
ncbi:hypothetical protein B7463_g11981, partial [Scytalidium lignicola]